MIQLEDDPVFHFHSWESGFLCEQSVVAFTSNTYFSPYLTVSRLETEMDKTPSQYWTMTEDEIRFAAYYERRLLDFCDNTIVESDADKKYYKAIGHHEQVKKVVFTPDHSISLDIYIPSKKEFHLISGGRAVWEKGFDLLVQSLPTLEDELGATINLTILCREKSRTTHKEKYTDYLQYLSVLVDSLDLRGSVHLENKVVVDELITIIGSSDGLVIPSRFDPFCLMPLYGWAAKKPVFISTNTGISEIVEDDRFLFDPSQPASLADKFKGVVDQSIEFTLIDLPNTVSSIYTN